MIGSRLWMIAAHRPVDLAAILCASAASLIIIVNAVFLQSGPHPAPFFANPTALPPPAADNRPTSTVTPVPKPPETRTADKPAEATPARPSQASRTPPAPPLRRNDPIGDLIGASAASSSRIAAVQRVLSDFGYGQLRASGSLDEPTKAAIEKFESEHKLPVTGRLSDRLLNELAALTGHPIQ
ncbi:MAG: peptidoglycan-binding protein [Xanthobacteraceae bacterium]